MLYSIYKLIVKILNNLHHKFIEDKYYKKIYDVLYIKSELDKEVAKLNKSAIMKVINDNKGHPIIFIGFVQSGMKFLNTKFTHKFSITIPYDKLYLREN